MAGEIEVYRDLVLRGPVERRPSLRQALIAAAVTPWSVDLDRSAEIARNAFSSADVVLFRRLGSSEFPAAGLTLWSTDDGYYVPNIVPLEVGSLTYSQYNAILADFIDRIVTPTANSYSFSIGTTKADQMLEDWVSPDVATKLRRFSGAANKSTGASHPMDERRWFDFLIEAHRAGDQIGTDRLARWLNEVEGWDEDTAHRLAGNYENSLALLNQYDRG